MTTARRTYLLAAALAVATVLLLLLGIGALGIVGDGDRDALDQQPGDPLPLRGGGRCRLPDRRQVAGQGTDRRLVAG